MQVLLNNRNVHIICINQPEFSLSDFDLFLEKLSQMLSCCLREKSEIILAGDFSINLLVNTPATKTFKAPVEIFGHQITIHEPTRISKTATTCINNIITNIIGTALVIEEHISDHSAQKFVFPKQIHINEVEKKQCRHINQNNMRKFIDCISYQDWFNVSEDVDGDENLS